MGEKDNYNLGVQPIDQIMINNHLKNSDLVNSSEEQLTFKMLQKARRGRRLTPNIKNKILRAINALNSTKTYTMNELFNY